MGGTTVMALSGSSLFETINHSFDQLKRIVNNYKNVAFDFEQHFKNGYLLAHPTLPLKYVN